MLFILRSDVGSKILVLAQIYHSLADIIKCAMRHIQYMNFLRYNKPILVSYRLWVCIMIKVFIVDDHRALLDTFRCTIGAEEDMVCIGSATNSLDAQTRCSMLCPDVVLTDVSMEAYDSGLVLTKHLKTHLPDVKVIVMSGFDELSFVSEAKQAGADAFLSKSNPTDRFIAMVRAVVRNEGTFPETEMRTTVQRECPFSDRENEILHLLCKFLDYSEIADRLHISQAMYRQSIEDMLRKSDCKNATELVACAISNGWQLVK